MDAGSEPLFRPPVSLGEGGSIMADQHNHNELNRTNRNEDEMRHGASLDSELHPDPELAEGPVSGGRIALFAVAIAVVLGAVFYGLNNTSLNSNGTSTTKTTPANQSTAQTSPQPSDTAPGTTTGVAPARPQQPPAAAPSGADVNRSGNPPVVNNAPAGK
jgi:hypothetical protein